MVEISGIKDSESLEAWLEGQPREVSVWIASRAAARVLPLLWRRVLTKDWARKRDLTALPVLRSLLISSVAAKMSTYEMKAAAARAVAADFWDIVRADAAQVSDGDIPWILPLWGEAPNPFAENWQEVKARVQASDTADDWQFWIDWYQALLDGRPMLGDDARTWEMFEKIALIAPKDWKPGPAKIAAEIRRLFPHYGGRSKRNSEATPPTREDVEKARLELVEINSAIADARRNLTDL